MSVRATGSLIGDPVYVTAIPGGPRMIVTSIDADTKQVTTIWFSSNGGAQQGVFPAAALDRVELTDTPQKKTVSGAKPGGKKK